MSLPRTPCPWTRPSVAGAAILAGAVILFTAGGCRAIRRHVDSRQDIAARKLAREGLEAMHEERWDTAEQLFLAALELNHGDDRAHWGMAEALWERGERAAAIEHMEQAARLSGADPQLVVRLGRMYFDVGRIEDAQGQLTILMESGRDLAATWLLRGDVMSARGADDTALAAYHRALALQSEYPEAQIAIADLYHRHARYDRCLATLDRLQDNIDTESCPSRAHELRGLAMLELGRPREAADCFQMVARRNPHDPHILLRVAEAEYAAGDFAAAKHALGRVLQVDSSNPSAQALIARIEDHQQHRLTR